MTITAQDVLALAGLLRRLPMSDAELLYVSGLLERLAQLVAPQAAPAAPEPAPEPPTTPSPPE